MKQIVYLVLFLSFIYSSYTLEYTESHLKSAEKLIEVTEMKNVDLDLLADEVFTYLEIDRRSENYDELKKIYIKEFRSDYLIQIRDLYVSYYTEEEVNELLTFYKTPLGKKVLDNSDQLNQDIVLTAELWTQKIFSKLQGQTKDEN